MLVLHAGVFDRTWLAVDRGDKTRNWTTENPFLTLNPERFTVKKERFTSPAIRHCFLSGFDHRADTRFAIYAYTVHRACVSQLGRVGG
jgi:hypothetical protein